MDGPFGDVGRRGDSSLFVEQHVVQLACGLDDEERELWKQLRRKREFDARVEEKRAHLAQLEEDRRVSSKTLAEAMASVERLSSELEIARKQERELEHEIALLEESNRILRGVFQNPRLHDDQPEESVTALHEQIDHLRGTVECMLVEKAALQDRQVTLFQQQHAAEQDRNRLLSSLQDDRKAINDLRLERIRLWEERCATEKEMARIVQEAYFGNLAEKAADAGIPGRSRWADERPSFLQGPLGSSPFVAKGGSPMEDLSRAPEVSGGVRVPVVRDSPSVFDTPKQDTGDRAHWRKFDGGEGESQPGGITDWSAKMQDYRAARRD